MPDYCPRCCLRLRAKPAVREYRESFAESLYWMMITPSFESDPEQAGHHGHDQDKPSPGLSEIEKAIGRAALQQREGIEV